MDPGLLSHPDVAQYSFQSVRVVDDYTVTIRVAATNLDELDRIYRELTEVYRADLPVTRLVTITPVVFAHRRLRGLQRLQGHPDRYMEDL